MTKTETMYIMAILREAYPLFYKDKTQEDAIIAINLWYKMFNEYQYELVEAAVEAYIATDSKGYPPVIGQILEKVRKLANPEELTEFEAWNLVKKALQRSGYNACEEFKKLPRTVRRVVGDPVQLKAWAVDDNFNEAVTSSNFMRSYRTVAQQESDYNAWPDDVKRLAERMANQFSLPDGAVTHEVPQIGKGKATD